MSAPISELEGLLRCLLLEVFTGRFITRPERFRCRDIKNGSRGFHWYFLLLV